MPWVDSWYIPLRMVWTDVTVIACFGFTRLLKAKFVPDVALLAAPNRLIGGRDADAVAVFARKRCDLWSFKDGDRITGFIGCKASLWDRLVHRHQGWG
jgi:hypothetical protein